MRPGGNGAIVLDRPGNLFIPLGLSVLLHTLFLGLFALRGFSSSPTIAPPLDIEILEAEEAKRRFDGARPRETAKVEKAPKAEEEAPALPKSQIVSPPEGPEAVPDDTRFLSDRNTKVPEEMVKRGEPAPPAEPPRDLAKRAPEKPGRDSEARPKGAEPKPRSVERGKPAPSSPQLPGLESLFAKPSDLIGDPRLGRGTSEERAGDPERRDYASIDRPQLWANPGERGTPDYLPDIRQGSFTLLNTKADLFAPFVRRVGLRVFQSFSMDFKRQIFSGGVPQGNEQVEIEAVMSPDGRKIEVALKRRSGNLSTDRVLLGTLRDEIFFDENPPAKAVAADGRIHFVFALDASVWYGRDDGGAVQPGARWIFGAGLL